MKMIRILLVDDHKILRDGLRLLLSLEKDMEVVGEAGDGLEAVRLAGELNPQVVVMDVGIAGLNGIEATRRIHETVLGAHVLGLSVHKERQFVVGMLEAGARGYLLKECAGEELVSAIRAVMTGQIYVSSQVSGVLVEDYLRKIQSKPIPMQAAITPREMEVLRLLALGGHNKQIAQSLGIGEKTVETHRRHIMGKLDFQSIADLTRFAIREGIISSDD